MYKTTIKFRFQINNGFIVARRCNGARRMSEGGLVMPACSANNFNNNNRMAATLPKRKFSFPATLHSPSLQAELANCNGVNVGPSLTVATARRRFSNVSDVVSRKLSHTIGWRTAVPTEQIARQGKYMCVQYVRWKLKRAGVYTKKCAGALRCARAAVRMAAATEENATAADPHGSGYFIPPQVGSETSVPVDDTQNDSVPREVFPAVLRVGLHLERLDPKLYAADTRVCSVTSSEKITSPSPSAATTLLQQRLEHRNPTFGWDDDVTETTTAAVLLVSVSRELFRAGAQVTWAKIVSLLCFASRLAVDCARRGNAEQLPDLIEAVGEVIEDDLAAWIHYNGGWVYIHQNIINCLLPTRINNNYTFL